jgi:hypothetical protein
MSVGVMVYYKRRDLRNAVISFFSFFSAKRGGSRGFSFSLSPRATFGANHQMPQGYLWCKPSANSALVRRYYETDDRCVLCLCAICCGHMAGRIPAALL